MGNSESKNKKKNKALHKDIQMEHRKFQSQRTRIAICGASKSGKSSIINQAIKKFGSTKITEFIESDYMISNNIQIHEYCDPKLEGVTSFKYLDCFTIVPEHQWIEYESKTEREQKKYLDFIQNKLIVGFLREIALNTAYDSIVSLIQQYYNIHINTYSLRQGYDSFEFWELNDVDFYEQTVEELQMLLNAMVFIIDLSLVEQIDASIDLFLTTAKFNTFTVIVYLNKRDIFKEKIENMTETSNCKALEKYGNSGYDEALQCIRTSIESRWKYSEQYQLYFFYVEAVSDGCMRSAFGDTFHYIITDKLRLAGLLDDKTI